MFGQFCSAGGNAITNCVQSDGNSKQMEFSRILNQSTPATMNFQGFCKVRVSHLYLLCLLFFKFISSQNVVEVSQKYLNANFYCVYLMIFNLQNNVELNPSKNQQASSLSNKAIRSDLVRDNNHDILSNSKRLEPALNNTYQVCLQDLIAISV